MKVEKFRTWLGNHGAVVLEPTNPWEVIRFKTVNGVSVVYTNKNGHLTFTGESSTAYDFWQQGKHWKPKDRKRQSLKAQKARLATRDGKRCFCCAKAFTLDELTVEHLLSFVHGGTDNHNNLTLVCEPCNIELGSLAVAKKIETIVAHRRLTVAEMKSKRKLEQLGVKDV